MTPYVTRLLNSIRNTPLNQYDLDNFVELVVYIEELERKAQAYDDADCHLPSLGDQTYGK